MFTLGCCETHFVTSHFFLTQKVSVLLYVYTVRFRDVPRSKSVNNHIWIWFDFILCVLPCRALADTRQIGKLTREQFALAMHLIQQKVSKGIDPPQTLTADMIPPSERGTPVPVGSTPYTRSACLVQLSDIFVWVYLMGFFFIAFVLCLMCSGLLFGLRAARTWQSARSNSS